MNGNFLKTYLNRSRLNKVKMKKETTNPLDSQVGGDHYKSLAIQPVEFIQRNNLNFCEGNIVKYICRHNQKGGRQDLEKVRHYLDLLIKLEYGE